MLFIAINMTVLSCIYDHSFGLTCVHLAAMIGQLSLVKKAEEYGGQLAAKDMKGRKPVDIAEANRHTDCQHYLESQALICKTQVSPGGNQTFCKCAYGLPILLLFRSDYCVHIIEYIDKHITLLFCAYLSL